MSTKIAPLVYATKLGNLTAKSVLALLADQANSDGLGWPSLGTICEWTEINLRTVRRMIQVFEAMGLVTRCTAMSPYGRKVDALQLNLDMLGFDLTTSFAEAYRAVGGTRSVAATADETVAATADETVVATAETVVATAETVVATEPPHPLIGGPVSDPLLTLPPVIPRAAGDGALELDPEQLAHLERCRPEDRARWELFYRESNEAKAHARRAAEELEAQARAEYPTRPAAIERVMRECGFQRGVRKRCVIGEVLGQVLDAEAARGHPVWATGPRLVGAWHRMQQAASRGSVRWGPAKFYRDGQWAGFAEGER